MKELFDISMKEVTDHFVNEIANNHGVTKAAARKLFINAITYNIVSNEIMSMVDYLMEVDSDRYME